MLSFYAFPPMGLADPDAFALQLRKRFKPFHALGRVYVAVEGVNAQMSVPTNVVPHFVRCCQSIPNFGEYIENGINVDPVPVSRNEQHGADPSSDDEATVPTTPFKNLHIRVRRQVVADGLAKAYDWQSAGYDMPPLEWHEALHRATLRRERLQLPASVSEVEDEPLPILLDCRNKYETDIGTFEGAEPLNTENFRDSWGVLEERLKDVPKDAPIMVRVASWGSHQCLVMVHFVSHDGF
jgi:predicted sulfurtransferase